MVKPGRKTNISKGKDPPKPGRVRSKKSRAKTREIKFMQFYFRVEALVMRNLARHALAGEDYQMAFGKRFGRGTDVDEEVTRKLLEEVIEDTEWAETNGPPPEGWIPPKWIERK